MHRWFAAAIASLFVMISILPALAQEPKAKGKGQHEHLNKKFEDPKLKVDDYVKRFEAESREVAGKKAEVIALCGLKPGMAVADVGAGTGLYAFPFAEKVAPGGTVYAVDISPAFLKYLGDQAKERKLDGVLKPIKGGQDTTNLPEGKLDLVFICDTYHHFEKPKAMLDSIFKALKPGGKVVVIDFDKNPGASAFIKEHARAEKEVYFQEFAAAGFVQDRVENPPSFRENFTAMFHKP